MPLISQCVLLTILTAACPAIGLRRHSQKTVEDETQGSVGSVAGVPILNYHLKGKSWRREIHHPLLVGLQDQGQDDWLIALNPDDTTDEKIQENCAQFTNAQCTTRGHTAFYSFISVHSTEEELVEVIQAFGGARFVEVDVPVGIIPEINGTEGADGSTSEDRRWSLKRVGVDRSARTGRGVHVYVLDTGIKTTHEDFGGRADAFAETVGVLGFAPGLCQRTGGWFAPQEDCGLDVQGHGTHCAGTVGGSTWGVAPEAFLHSVKVLADSGHGGTSGIVSGMDLVVTAGQRPAVLSMSLGGQGSDRALNEAVDRVVENGLTVVVAAGNEFVDACNGMLSRVANALTVGATTSQDSRSDFSSWGSCVDIYAPGSDIWSAGLVPSYENGSIALSGTSMACPAVSGAVALLLEASPSMDPRQIKSALRKNSLVNYLNNLSPGELNNNLLYVGEDGPTPPRSEPPPDTEEWPPAEYWNRCKGAGATGPFNIFPFYMEPWQQRHCKCSGVTVCYASDTASERGCPLSEQMQNWSDVTPILQHPSRNFIWSCPECACYGPFGGIR